MIKKFKKLKDKIFSEKQFSLSTYFTLTVFIVVLILSWVYFSTKSRNNEEQLHSLLQDRFQNLVSDFVAKKHPEVDEVIFHKVWTENTSNPSKVKIYFNYTLKTKGLAGGSLLADGSALLEKAEARKSLWLVQDFQLQNSELEFSEPLLIKAPSPSKEK